MKLFGLLSLLVISTAALADVTPSIHLYDSSSGQPKEVTTRYLGDVNFIQVNGLKPNENYTISNQAAGQGGTYESKLITQSDGNGSIDSRTAIPAPGSSYQYAESDGLFWAMTLNPSNLSGKQHAYQITVENAGTFVQQTSFPIAFLKPGVQTVNLPNGLVGKLYLPTDSGPHPAIITYSGSEGGVLTGEMNANGARQSGIRRFGNWLFQCTRPTERSRRHFFGVLQISDSVLTGTKRSEKRRDLGDGTVARR